MIITSFTTIPHVLRAPPDDISPVALVGKGTRGSIPALMRPIRWLFRCCQVQATTKLQHTAFLPLCAKRTGVWRHIPRDFLHFSLCCHKSVTISSKSKHETYTSPCYLTIIDSKEPHGNKMTVKNFFFITCRCRKAPALPQANTQEPAPLRFFFVHLAILCSAGLSFL